MHAFLPADHPFLGKHAAKIAGVLSCFDRVIFRGYLPICHPRGVLGWLHQLGVAYTDFKNFAPKLAERLLQHAKDTAQAAGRPYRYLPKRESKEELARQIAARDGITEGLVCVFSCLETCRTFRLRYGQGRQELTSDLRRCTVVYYFFLDAEFGLIHVKLQTWLPLTCQVYVNGHSWLERQLRKHGIAYQMVDNAFVDIADAAAAQRLADGLLRQNWVRRLSAWGRRVNPLLAELLRGPEGKPGAYYWVSDQAEYATDVMFRDRQDLSGLYPALLEHATLAFGSEDVLRFLGRKPSPCFKGEVQTERKLLPIPEPQVAEPQGRVEGVRVKHVMKTNRLKMYDKAGRVLRIETVINDPTEFRVRRWQESKHGGRRLAWQPLRKGVAWLWRYAEVALAANRRYLEALANAEDHTEARQLWDRVSRPARYGRRRRRALQPLSPEDQALFLAVLRGEHHLHGLRNRDLAQRLCGEPPRDPAERRRRSARMTRLIQLLRAHGVLAKVPRSRRYRLTASGERLLSSAVYIRYKHLPKDLSAAA
jgi:hypothetical protein